MTSSTLRILGIAALAFSEQVAVSQTINGVEVRGGTATVVAGKTPSVQITDPDGKVLASIPIENNPGKFVYSEPTDTLYIVNSSKKRNTISALNLSTKHVDRRITVGAGTIVELLMSPDRRRLYCYTAASVNLNSPLSNGFSLLPRYFKPPYAPSVSVIDTSSNELISTKSWLDSFTSRVPAKRNTFTVAASLLLGTDQGSVAIVSSAFSLRRQKLIFEELDIFTDKGSQPASTLQLKAKAKAWLLSKDESVVFAAFNGGKNAPGSLAVIDMPKGILVERALTDNPRGLFRLGSQLNPWILGDQEMRSFSETGELGDMRIALGKTMAREPTGESEGGSALLDGYPGETISVGKEHAAIMISNQNGSSRHKVALIDLNKRQIAGIVPTMSRAEIAGIRTGRYLSAFGLSLATGGNLSFAPNMSIRNESLAARPDGRNLYVLDVEGHEVTVVDVATTTVVNRLKVNSSVIRIHVSQDGKHLICLGRKTQQIDLGSNKLEE